MTVQFQPEVDTAFNKLEFDRLLLNRFYHLNEKHSFNKNNCGLLKTSVKEYMLMFWFSKGSLGQLQFIFSLSGNFFFNTTG